MVWLTKAGEGIKAIVHLSVLLIALGVVWQVLFGAAVPFVGGDVVGNISGLVNTFLAGGVTGLVTLIIIGSLWD